jgi:hypothetical protein
MSTKRRVVTDRDREILTTLSLVDVMTGPQLRALFFPGTSDLPFIRCMQFLKSLKQVHQETLPISSGGRPLEGYSRRPINPANIFLAHKVGVAEVFVRFTLMARQYGYTFDEWNIPKKKKEKDDLIPDAVYVINTPEKPYRFLLEVDRGKETLVSAKEKKDLEEKFTKYRWYFLEQGGKSQYELEYGTRGGRVLIVAQYPKRLQNIKALCEKLGGRTRYWFTTMDELKTHDVLYAPIWYKAGSQEAYSLI